ncbi:hypothetical protein BDV25DRAFT_146628 [Aspergillus avenaceus]|uniref:Uncharacterized protein n=1 Tax=Aspergillus avenaceus TaxID=36643 RepID=A0A5N6U967_ASPAV|nr:hypothetical protein BDV25DRAFT_146628 [Aspergillus avenaceus]
MPPSESTSKYPTPNTPTKTIGIFEVCEVEGVLFRRRRGTEHWAKYSPSSQSAPQHYDERPILSLVHERQEPGEPLHWSLFVARENEPGFVYQVTGDAEYMVYVPSLEPTDLTVSEAFLTLYELAPVTEEQRLIVEDIASKERPPSAANRRSVTENCQGWTVRVITRLVERGIVPDDKLEMAKSMLQPL